MSDFREKTPPLALAQTLNRPGHVERCTDCGSWYGHCLLVKPWRSVGRDFPDDLNVVVDRATYWEPSVDWSQNALAGKVTLAGDAAHPMPPHRGQGLNNAVQDAAVFVDEISKAMKGEKTLKEGVQAYEKNMKARTLEEIPISIRQAQMVHNFDTLMAAPFFKHGLNKYRKELEARGAEVEIAADPVRHEGSPAQQLRCRAGEVVSKDRKIDLIELSSSLDEHVHPSVLFDFC